ncbi:unnamed protein product [Sphenostylis stenocarpa]|uniref:SKP1-like protein n=1 Tax=Sphenostylis stenocarpa TaxID=92480 RepID=A0AA86SII4_9FABA|nr:unnamed protein product [Sphenostylis stenocarpa]
MQKTEGEESKAENEEVKQVTLMTSDGVKMKVEISIVYEMEIVRSFIEVNDADHSVPFPLPNVSSHTLDLIIELVKNEYDDEFMKTFSHDELKEVLVAANYLNMKTLLDFIATAIANLLEKKSVEFIRNFFNIVNDFTPEEEAEIRKTNEWVFQDLDED